MWLAAIFVSSLFLCSFTTIYGQVVFSPTYGPMKGGTVVNVTVASVQGYDVISVKLAGVDAKLLNTTVFKSQGWLTCESNISPSLVTGNVTVEATTNGNKTTFTSSDYFSYKPNPTIRKMESNNVIRSGGLDLRTSGEHLRSVQTPVMIIQKSYLGLEQQFESKCTVMSDNEMSCISPNLNVEMTTTAATTTTASTTTTATTTTTTESTTTSEWTTPTSTVTTTPFTAAPSTTSPLFTTPTTPVTVTTAINSPFQPVRKRRADAGQPDYFADFHLDGVVYNNFSRIFVYDDPEFYMFEGDEHTKKFFPQRETQIDVKGQRISLALRPSDIKVEVGLDKCFINNLTVNVLFCIPPRTEPVTETTMSPTQKGHSVKVQVGMRLEYFIGYLKYERIEKIPQSVLMLVLIVIAIVILWAIVFALLCTYHVTRRRKKKNANDSSAVQIYSTDSLDSNNQTMPFIGDSTSPDIDPLDVISGELRQQVIQCRLDSNRLHVGQCIGTGTYGRVMQGMLITEDATIPVAVKTLKKVSNQYDKEMTEFLEEALLMKDLQHPNILQLHGVVVFNYAPFVVFEFMEHGDLKAYVKKEMELTLKMLLAFALHICKALHYLSEKRMVHRDVAARNCLVNQQQVAKLGDFGLARDLHGSDYYKMSDKTKPLPVKWMALESLQLGKFTTHSDVWSFGVLLWEILSRGPQPYATVQNVDIKDHVKAGYRLPKPSIADENLYNIMTLTWREDPSSRPTFDELVVKLQTAYDKITDI